MDQDQALRDTTEKLAHVATHDTLTGVANRNRFNTFIANALSAANPGGQALGVLQIDMDHFKAINDQHGHAAGDAALQHVATTIDANLRQTDLLVRMGGDEFVAVCPGLSHDKELMRSGRTLCDAVRAPLVFDGKEISLSISVGAVLTFPQENDSDQLLQKSDLALYEVKRKGRNDVAVYNSELHAEAQRRSDALRLAAQLRDTIENGGLIFYFQPTIDLITHRVKGFEALARWQHPTIGLMHPSVFLPLAKELNLLRQIDIAAISAAASLRKRLYCNGFNDIRVGLNGSYHLLQDTDHINLMPALAARLGVQAHHIVIELAERDVFSDLDSIGTHLSAIARLVDRGFSVMIDSFGAGYAGLLHVERLAVAGFKIEKALIRHLDSAPACERITAMLLQFGHEKAIYCVASGIETAAQSEMVKALGGTVGQGNHFARAMPSEDVIDWLRDRSARFRLQQVG